MTLLEQLNNLDYPAISSPEVAQAFQDRIKEGNLIRDENPISHFDVYFLPYNADTKQVFLVHHKKANSWISPGGHIDQGETMDQAVSREISEELGVTASPQNISGPFLLTIKEIDNPIQTCKKHFDIWYLLFTRRYRVPKLAVDSFNTDGQDFQIDPREFYDTKWLTIEEATKLAVNHDILEALSKLASWERLNG